MYLLVPHTREDLEKGKNKSAKARPRTKSTEMKFGAPRASHCRFYLSSSEPSMILLGDSDHDRGTRD
jgi:hypothetical protein